MRTTEISYDAGEYHQSPLAVFSDHIRLHEVPGTVVVMFNSDCTLYLDRQVQSYFTPQLRVKFMKRRNRYEIIGMAIVVKEAVTKEKVKMAGGETEAFQTWGHPDMIWRGVVGKADVVRKVA